jgi:hypothetical protein
VRRVMLPLIGLAALVTAACTMVAETVVNEDGSGYQSLRMTMDTALLAGFGVPVDELRADFESDAEMQALAAQLPPGVTLEVIDGDDGLGFEFRAEFGPTDDVGAAMEALAAQLEALGGGDVPFDASALGSEFTLRREGDEWVFRSGSEGLGGGALGDLLGDDPQAAAMASLFAAQMEVSMRLRLPGRLLSHNATRVEADGTLVWDLEMSEVLQNPVLMEARSSVAADEGGFPVAAAAAGGAGLVLALAIIAWAVLRRRTPV